MQTSKTPGNIAGTDMTAAGAEQTPDTERLPNSAAEPESAEALGRLFPHMERLAVSQDEYIRALERSIQLLQREVEHLRQTRPAPGAEAAAAVSSPDTKALRSTAQLIRSYSTPEQVIGSLQAYIDQRFPVLDSGMYLFAPGLTALTSASENSSERLTRICRSIDEECIIDWAIRQRRTLVIPNVADPDDSATSIVIIPLFLRGAAVGVFLALTTLTAQEIANGDLEGLTVLAESAAIAIDNIRSSKEISRMNNRLNSLNQQMVRSAKLASIGELAGSIAHEINNPLQILLGHIQLLESGVGDPGRRIKIVARQVDRIGEITQRLLDFARNVPVDSQPAPLDLNEAVERVLQFVGAQLQRDGIDVEFEPEAGPKICNGIRSQLEQVILNIILNARDAMPDGGKLTMALFEEGNNRLCLTIADTGLGIRRENLAQIFDSFFTTKPAGRGTGLGLSISRQIVEQHDGEISLVSEYGKGTTFRIVLPRLRDVTVPERATAEAAETQAASAQSHLRSDKLPDSAERV